MRSTRLCFVRSALVLYIVIGVAVGSEVQAQELPLHPTTPRLTGAECRIDLDITTTMKRATEALLAAGLTLHKPLPQTIGGNNEWVFAMINCERSEGTTRVISTVASNPARQGESYRVCMFLNEFMRTGQAPTPAALNLRATGVWDWKIDGHGGPATARVTLNHNGKAAGPGGEWTNGEWWVDGQKVFVYWPSPFPRTNLHYVITFTIADDGKTMSSNTPNYYVRGVEAARIGDAPAPPGGAAGTPTAGTHAPATPASGAAPANPPGAGGMKLLEPGAGEEILARLDAPRLPPAPLPLPPVGAMSDNAGRKADSAANIRLASLKSESSGRISQVIPESDVEIRQVTATHIPDPHDPKTADGWLQVDVALSKHLENHRVDIYVGGFLATPKEGILGLTGVGRCPAYQYKRVWPNENNSHPARGPEATNRRCIFPVPRVLPATIRAEVRDLRGRGGDHLVHYSETTFDLGWNDFRIVSGAVLGNRQRKEITKFALLVENGTTEVYFHMPGRANLQDRSRDLRIGVRIPKGTNEVRATTTRAVPDDGQWQRATLDVFPSLQDRDHRNNYYWPHLPNMGYVEAEPVLTALPPL